MFHHSVKQKVEDPWPIKLNTIIPHTCYLWKPPQLLDEANKSNFRENQILSRFTNKCLIIAQAIICWPWLLLQARWRQSWRWSWKSRRSLRSVGMSWPIVDGGRSGDMGIVDGGEVCKVLFYFSSNRSFRCHTFQDFGSFDNRNSVEVCLMT